MTCVSKTLIVGGGIAGLSAAIALSRAGIQCVIVELGGEPLGASLGVSGRAADALHALGAYEACHAESAVYGPQSTSLYRWNAAGALLAAAPDVAPTWDGAKPALGVYRPVLHRVLTELAEGLGAEMRRGTTFVSIVDEGDAVYVELSDGTTDRYDFVVGADGLNSATRKAVFPDAPVPTYVGQYSVRWMAPGPAVNPEGWYFSPEGRLGFYALPAQDLVYVPAVLNVPVKERWDEAEAHSRLRRLLESFTAPAVVELARRLTPESTVIARPFEWLLVPGPWHRGRVLLIGDAAHATTAHLGMGGCMAIEDAVVLGESVVAAGTLEEALSVFMARRLERVRTVVESSVALSHLEQRGAPPAESVPHMMAARQKLNAPY